MLQCRVQKVNHQQYAVWLYAQASGTEQCLIARIWISSILVSLSHFVLLHCWVRSMDDLCTFAPLRLQQGQALYFCTVEFATRTTYVLCTVEFATWTTFVVLHSWFCSYPISLQHYTVEFGFWYFCQVWIAIECAWTAGVWHLARYVY